MRLAILILAFSFTLQNVNGGVFYTRIYSNCAALDRMIGHYWVSECFATTTFFGADATQAALDRCNKKMQTIPIFYLNRLMAFEGIKADSMASCEAESLKYEKRIKEIGYIFKKLDLGFK